MVTAGTDLVGTGLLDSLALVELLAQLEETFGVSISTDDLELDNFRSISSIAGGRSSVKDWSGEKMNPVRPFTKNDIPQVVKLFQKVFSNGQTAPPSSKLGAYFEEMFFHNPWIEEGTEEGISSLVYETGDGEVTGFIGIIPRRMLLNGRPIRAAVSMHFMVEPGSRSTLAAVKLLNTFFSGPQDLSLTDGAGSVGRKIWEGLGGATTLAHSIRWTRLLRPSRYVCCASWRGETGHSDFSPRPSGPCAR